MRCTRSTPALPMLVVVTVTLAAGCRRSVSPDWRSYNNTLAGDRYSPLTQITTSNVAQLRQVCRLGMGEGGAFQVGPIVIGDTMFVTTAHTTAAINATNCDLFWRHVETPTGPDVFPVNRGVAYLDGRVFRGTADGRLLALRSDNGAVVWVDSVGSPSAGEFLSAAPVAWHGTVFTGLAGSDWGIRGRIMAYDAATGREKWRFWTIPTGSQPGAGTWPDTSATAHGGGGTWSSFALDTATGELFVPVANPAPDFRPDLRPGANLFTNSVVVLDADSGKLKWWYQLVPHDGLDWDLGAAPMLYTTRSGVQRVALGSKDGNVYALDRANHHVVFTTPVTTISNADKVPTPQGVRVCPGPLGGVEWNGPAYDPAQDAIYVGTDDWCAIDKSGNADWQPNGFYFGTAWTFQPVDTSRGWVVALDAQSGAVRWRFHDRAPVLSGVTPTAGGVVFAGDVAGDFYAFDAKQGTVLFRTKTGGSLAGGVVTYAVRGKQYVAFTSGNISRLTFTGATGQPTVVIMALGAPPGGVVKVSALPTVRVAAPATTPADSGRQVFATNCAGCHGMNGAGGVGARLVDEYKRKNLHDVIAWVENPLPPMPKLYPKPLDQQEVDEVAAYVEGLRSHQ